MDINISVMTPVHIGTGNEYNSLEFLARKVKKRRFIIRYNIEKIFKFMYKNHKDSYDYFLDFISKSETSLDEFSKEHPEEMTPIITSLSKYSYYSSFLRYPLTKKELSEGKRSKDITRIKEHLKTYNKNNKKFEAYIPGSSLKGAIRNCISYNTLTFRGEKNVFNIKKIIWDNDKNLNELMKYLHFTDSESVQKMAIYGTKSFGTRRNTSSFLETIDESKKLDYSIKFKYYTNYDENVHKLNKFHEEFLNIDKIFESIKNFSDDVIDHEVDFCLDNKLYDLLDFYDKLKILNKNKNSPLLRLGMGAGFLNMTTLLKLKNYDKNIFMDFKKKNNIGKKYKYDFPKTRRHIMGNHKPLGWVKLNKIEEQK